MVRYDKPVRALAICLSTLAGYVDAIGFIQTGGFFVSFMSGNSTRLGIGIAHGDIYAALVAGLLVTFVFGVMTGTFVGRMAGEHRRPVVLALVAALLALAAGSGMLLLPGAAVAFTALAMGAENAVFEEEGEVRIGLTYMTGALVKVGQQVTAALLGGRKWDWAPHFFLWLGLTIGAVAGGLVYPVLGLNSLWIAAAAAAALARIAWSIGASPMDRGALDSN